MSSSEREELELAAKAAGLVVAGWNDGEEPYSSGPGLILNDGRLWNSRDSSGQAFSLAARCGISFGIGSETGRPRVSWVLCGSVLSIDMPEDHELMPSVDWEEWGREAITRAAAEIGRAMP